MDSYIFSLKSKYTVKYPIQNHQAFKLINPKTKIIFDSNYFIKDSFHFGTINLHSSRGAKSPTLQNDLKNDNYKHKHHFNRYDKK